MKKTYEITSAERKIERINKWLRKQNRSKIVGFSITQESPKGGVKRFSAEWLELEYEEEVVMIYDKMVDIFNLECLITAFCLTSLIDETTHICNNKVIIKMIGDVTVVIEPITA